MRKRGQFYLIAALVIITMIITLVIIFNYSRREESSRVYDLSRELEIESSKVLDYGGVQGSYPWNDFTKNFTDYAGQEIDITYVIGDTTSQNAFYYNETGGQESPPWYWDNPTSTLIVTHNNVNYTFTFKEGENFYFVMSQYISGEYYVATN